MVSVFNKRMEQEGILKEVAERKLDLHDVVTMAAMVELEAVFADEQPRIAKEILHSMRHSEDISKMVKGLMIESYLVDGCQSPSGDVYGQSITDPWLGWEKTEKLILDMAELL